jgi:phage terminase Nu1 subunit (DNA packaging protein)
MQNAVTRKELAPAELIEEVLTKAGAKASKLLDTIPGELRRRAPQLTADDIAAIAGVIAKVRNIAAAISMSNLEEDDEDDEVSGAVILEEQRTEALLGLDADGTVQ